MEVIVGYQEEIAIINTTAIQFNQTLNTCKVVGLAIFCIGGVLLASALLLPSLVGLSCLDDNDDEQEPFKLKIAGDASSSDDDDDSDAKKPLCGSNNGGKNGKSRIPATEEVKSVQPKRDDEMIMTKEGLTKIE